MVVKNHIFLFVISTLILCFYPLITEAKLFESDFTLALQKNNTQKTTSNTNRSNVSEQVKNFRFPPLGSSRRVTTGATRTDTNILKILVPSIVNEQNTQSEFNIYSTYSEYPTFVIYFDNPQTEPKDTKVKFTIHNSDNSKINETYFKIRNSGIYLFTLPNNQSGLKINSNYSWQFSLVYGDRNQYILLSDQGLIQRQSIPTEINQQLSEISDIEKLIIYGKNQIWYDTVSYLTNLYCLDNNTYKESWLNLLNSTDINLDKLVIQDLLSCHDITFLAEI